MRTSKILTLAFLGLGLAGCTNGNEIALAGSQRDTPITIASAGVAELTTRSAETNPLVGTSTSPATMGVFVTGGFEDKYDATNVQWKHAGTSWENQGTTMLYEGELSEQKIYAYSPYDANVAADGTIAVTADGTSDWLVATEASLAGSSVSLTMTHALAKLVLKPTFGSEVTNQTITKVEVGGMYASGTLNIAENTWSGLSEANATLTMTNNEALVIPMASCASLPITVTTGDGRTFKADVSLAAESIGGKLAAGTQYNITLQLGQDKVNIGGITVTPWGEAVPSGNLATE